MLGLAVAIALFSTRAFAAPAATVVVSGLDEPKQPVVGPNGWVYVAVSGTAGPTDPALAGGDPFNKSGGVVRISTTGTVSPVVSGLLSRFDEGTAIGPSGLAWWNGGLYVAQGLDDPLNSPTGALLSSPVLKVTGGGTRTFTSFNAVSNDLTSESGYPDTNPFGCAVGSDNLLYVSDGGENAVWRVDTSGDASLLVQFPGDPTIAGIAAIKEPKHADRRERWNRFGGLVVCLFGNGKSGFANGSVMTVNESGTHTLVPTGTITMPIGAAYSPSGQLYILQFATPNPNPGPPFAPGTGAIWAVSSTGAATKVLSGFNYPTGITFAPDGTAYVTNNGILPGTGTATGELEKVTGL
jgi:sugar lactone lactonase YvrE